MEVCFYDFEKEGEGFKGVVHRMDNDDYDETVTIYLNECGLLHRLDGPAFESHDSEKWFVNGKRHRLDGYAYYFTVIMMLMNTIRSVRNGG